MQQHVFTISKICSNFGIEHAVICPGSRSAPLVFAFTQNKKIKCHSAIDERSAGFMALGMAQQLLKPVVLVCTSGTAVLNFFPAVAEAFYQKIPLLILSADRPPEQLNQQDGQMIMQKGVFGKHVLASHELLCFEEDKVDFKLTERIVNSALYECIHPAGFGPVHINVPLREPLYDLQSNLPIPKLHFSKEHQLPPIPLPAKQLDSMVLAWKQSKKRMILVGQMPVSKNLHHLLNSCINQDDVVVLADVVSNQHETSNVKLFDAIIEYHSWEDIKDLEPDFILSIGGPMVSKSLKNWLKTQHPTFHCRIQRSYNIIDTYNNVTNFVVSNELDFLEAFVSVNRFKQTSSKPYASEWKMHNRKTEALLKDFVKKPIWSEPIVLHHLLKFIPENTQLQLANSSVVRFVSSLGLPLKALHVFGNRGTNGIDGVVSTALGSARVLPHVIVTLITGDLSLFYDRNAFWQKELPPNLKVIVMNNFGGRIFEWIEGPSLHADDLHFFTTEHHHSVKLLAEQNGLNYFSCSNFYDLESTLSQFYEPQNSVAILELAFRTRENIETIKEFKNMEVNS